MTDQSHVQAPTAMGSDLVVEPVIKNTAGDWSPYITLPSDNQWAGSFDEDNCVTQAGIHAVEMIMNYAIATEQLPEPLIAFLEDPANGFMNENAQISLSVRFSSAMNGTTANGLPMDDFWKCLNRDGFVPKTKWPNLAPGFTRAEYYATPDASVIKDGQLAAVIFQWTWQCIVNGDWNAPNIPLLQKALTVSPLHFAAAVGSMLDGVEQPAAAKVYQHSRDVYKIDSNIEVLDSEFNASPEKKLALTVPLACVMTASLNIK